MIEFIKDVDIFSHVKEYDAILLGTNTCYYMRNGFQHQVSLHYPYVYETNLKTKYGDKKKLGTVIECCEENKPAFLLCYINDGLNTRPDIIKDYLSYDSLEKCLKLANSIYRGKRIASTFIGCSKFDGNGDKEKVKDIISSTIKNCDLTIYDYIQKSRDEMYIEVLKQESEIKAVDRKKYYEIVSERKKIEKKLRELNGRAAW